MKSQRKRLLKNILKNKRFLKKINIELYNTKRYKNNYSIIMFEIEDNYKYVKMIKNELRFSDSVLKIEEFFFIFLPFTCKNGAEVVAKSFQSGIEEIKDNYFFVNLKNIENKNELIKKIVNY